MTTVKLQIQSHNDWRSLKLEYRLCVNCEL